MRKTKDVTINIPGRDQGRVYRLTELSAFDVERWALRAASLLAKAGVELGDLATSGMIGIAYAGLQSLGRIDPLDAEPLLSQMMQCVRIVPDPIKTPAYDRPLSGQDDIEELATIFQLRKEVFELHTGFSEAGARSSPQTAPPAVSPSKSSPSGRISRTKPRP